MSINDAANNTMNDIELAEDEDINTVLADDIDISGLTLDTSSSFDVILNNKIGEINELYELKTKNKKMISNANEINFMDKKLYNKINAAIDKKYKESKQYKKKCEEEVQKAL